MRSYNLKIPQALIFVLKLLMYVGMGLIVFSMLPKLFGHTGGTFGHVMMGLFMMLTSFLIIVAVKRWQIRVEGEQITIRYSLKKERMLTFEDIDYASIGLKDELRLYSKEKKIVTIDRLVVNIGDFIKVLKERKIKIEYQEQE
ncbi:DUF6560 family protein [Enterococcus sp. LJL51]|uniref:DUF6560 family protein n=1 Tax=Enterococcus sp. LJL51 TaxID=3416656 RepID=UPI003CF3D43B